MACSKYEYVKEFQEHRTALMDTYLVVRIDGRGFTKFCEAHHFTKPNDLNAIKLMNSAARELILKFPQIFLAYGQSDEYSFALPKDTKLFNRRIDKIETCMVSYFTASYILKWDSYFPEMKLQDTPSFDCRIVQYPNMKTLKDYFRWRQVDCHINNLYNTVFWSMIQQKKMKPTEVEQALKITNSGEKNQILFQQFGINYNNIDQIYRKGTIFCYKLQQKQPKLQKQKLKKILPINIRKQLFGSISQLKILNANMEKMRGKLEKSQVQEDLMCFQELTVIQDQLRGVEEKYGIIEERIKGNKMMVKEGKAKYKLVQSYEDLINEEFWENIKID